jgi:hypothetical protein
VLLGLAYEGDEIGTLCGMIGTEGKFVRISLSMIKPEGKRSLEISR